jgi:glycine/D-amino acid oxidase-like deaminating enzyme
MAHSRSKRRKTLCAQAVLASVVLSALLFARSAPPSFPQRSSVNASISAVTHHDQRPRFDHNHAQWNSPQNTCLPVPPALESAHVASELQLAVTLLIRGAFDGYSRLGLQDHYQILTADQAQERVRVTNVKGALFAKENASIHPGRLVRGLARAVENLGGTIYEATNVINFRDGDHPRLITPGGEVQAGRAIVLAGESYLSRFARLHRALLPVYSLIAATEPLTAEQWSVIGWAHSESLESCNYTVEYLTRTADGRILFGSRGAPYRFGSKISDDQDRHAETHARIQEMTQEWFPVLEGIRFTHHWGGPVGMPRDWMPMAAFDPTTKVATARGYTGQGVSTTNLMGRVLAELITGQHTDLSALPIAQRSSPSWEPEPLRWLVVRYMQNAFLRIDAAGRGRRRKPIDASLAEYLGRH